MPNRSRSILFLMLILPLLALVACSEDDSTGPGGGDTTPPTSVGTNPGTNDSNVGLDDEIRVTFSEAMNKDSADGNVAITPGTISSLTWENGDKTLVIDHSTWAEGAQVTVTIGANIEDAAGNKLGTPYAFSFWTQTSQVVLLAMEPADGAIGVQRNASISLLFSRRMDLTSIENATTISDNNKTNYAFTAHGGDGEWVVLDVEGNLAATTLITVAISTSAQDQSGNNLESAASFSFTTSAAVDDTPPTLVSAEPPSGSTFGANQAFIRFTFSEPIDDTQFQPSRINAEFLLLVNGEGSVTWSPDYTQLTVTLPTPLPAGTPMEVEFATIVDRNGVVQDTPITWSGKVSGTPDYFPLSNGAQYVYYEMSEEGDIGNTTPNFTDEYPLFVQFDTQGSDGTFRWAYYDETYTTTDEWETYKKSSSELTWTGFRDSGSEPPEDFTITPGMRMLPIPPSAGTWTINSTASSGTQSFDATGDGETVGQEDLPLPLSLFEKAPAWGKRQEEVYWAKAWRVEVNFVVKVGGETFLTSERTLWFAANYGLVQAEFYEENFDEARWDHNTTYQIPPTAN